MVERVDLGVVGGGIVGLAAARSLARRHPEWTVALLEKEAAVGRHQTGHNSGVVHSGVYYRPGSLKARLCLEGRARLLRYAAANGIAAPNVGKLIVAGRPQERPMLDELERRAQANGVDSVRRLDSAELRSELPGVAGVGALKVPSAAIIDFAEVARHLAGDLAGSGAAVLTGWTLRAAEPEGDGWRLSDGSRSIHAGRVVNCAGLEADLVARRMGVPPPIAIVGFRGEFYRLSARLRERVRCLVYPVPNPAVPFLGVHLTPTVHGELLAGPNAALALAREGYRPGSIEVRELWRMASFAGTLGLARRYGRLAAREWLRSWSPAAYLDAVRAIWPDAEREDLGPRSSGVRAQAVRPDGSLEDDFVFARGPSALHVLNAPSPAATAAFAIAERVADALEPEDPPKRRARSAERSLI